MERCLKTKAGKGDRGTANWYTLNESAAVYSLHVKDTAGDTTALHRRSLQNSRPGKDRRVPGSYLVTMLACIFLFGTACSSQKAPSEFGEPRASNAEQSTPSASPDASTRPQVGQEQLLAAQSACSKKVQVLFSAPVEKLLPNDRHGTPHQRFLLQLSNGTSVLVAHNTKMAPAVPVQAGDVVVIKGEYIWNEKGGVVHWTHHTDTRRHEGGYIQFNGQTYQ